MFQLIQKPDDGLAWNVIAFSERHPRLVGYRDLQAHKLPGLEPLV